MYLAEKNQYLEMCMSSVDAFFLYSILVCMNMVMVVKCFGFHLAEQYITDLNSVFDNKEHPSIYYSSVFCYFIVIFQNGLNFSFFISYQVLMY